MGRGMRRFLHEDDGQGLVEYALLIALIAIVSVLTLTELGSAVKNTFERSSNSL
jgi:pilus assembly protein Flp/PilA